MDVDCLQAIEAIPLDRSFAEDKLIWSFEKSGEAVKRSLYAFISTKRRQESQKPSSSHQIPKQVCNGIWSIQCPQKIKSFMWRATSNAVATESNLLKRDIGSSRCCEFCGDEEDIEHLLLDVDGLKVSGLTFYNCELMSFVLCH